MVIPMECVFKLQKCYQLKSPSTVNKLWINWKILFIFNKNTYNTHYIAATNCFELNQNCVINNSCNNYSIYQTSWYYQLPDMVFNFVFHEFFSYAAHNFSRRLLVVVCFGESPMPLFRGQNYFRVTVRHFWCLTRPVKYLGKCILYTIILLIDERCVRKYFPRTRSILCRIHKGDICSVQTSIILL
jgi:hypothetical protein